MAGEKLIWKNKTICLRVCVRMPASACVCVRGLKQVGDGTTTPGRDKSRVCDDKVCSDYARL